MKRKCFVSLFLVISLFVNVTCTRSTTTEDNATASANTTIKLLDSVETSWDGADLISYPTGKPAITLLKITVAPHCKLPQHYHPVINVGYMLEGSLTVTDDKGNSKTITAGEPLVETVNTIHYGENRGDTNAVIIVFYAGEVDSSITEISDVYPI